MAKDYFARMLAASALEKGGTSDAYTKDETDALLAAKADTTYVDSIADMVISKMQLWADYIADYDTAMLAKQATLDMSDSEKKQQFVMQKAHLQKLKSKYAYLQAYYEQHGELPETVTFDSITNAGGCMYRTESDGEVKVAVLKGSANGMIVDSPDFTATASTSDASRTTAHQISSQFGIEVSGWGWISVSIETTGTLFSSFSWSGYPSASPAWWGVQMNGNTYIPVITGTRSINGYTFDNGILFSLSENTVDAETPWDYYNNYVLPDLAAGNAAFPTGYAPTPKAKFYTKDETDELLEDVEEEISELLEGKADIIDGKIPASELPSYVDDTIEGYYYEGAFYEDSSHTTAITGETGKIYIDLTANKSYRWTGTVYVRIDECPAFGETQGTIYEGHKGKANADAIAAIKDGTNIDSFADVETALAAKLNTSDVDETLNSTSTNPVQNKAVQAPIAILVDRGAKNLSPVNDVIFTGPVGAAYTDPIAINLAPGEYVVRYKLTTTANAAVAITYDDSEHLFYDSSSPYSDTVITHNFTVVNSGTSFRFYFNQAATVSDLMIVPKLIWDVSNTYIPYAPTNRQLYEMIGNINPVRKAYYTAISVPGTSTLSSTGVTYTVPAGDICRITAAIVYNGSAPSKIQVKFKSMVIAEASASGAYDMSVSAVGVTAPQAADQTVEVYGQWASTTGTNTVLLLVEKLN